MLSRILFARRRGIGRLFLVALLLAAHGRAEPGDDDSGDDYDYSSGDSGSGDDATPDDTPSGTIEITADSFSDIDSSAPDSPTPADDTGGSGDDFSDDDSPPPNPPPPPPSPPPPSAGIATAPGGGMVPLTVTVNWTTANADSAVIAGAGLASSALSGSQGVTLTSPGYYTYTITASGAGGQDTETAAVTASSPQYALTTAAVGDGSVTPGGTYPAATTVAVGASPGGNAYFTGWTGSLGGTVNPLLVTLSGDMTLVANFASMQAQSIALIAPATAIFPGPAVTLTASATSGLPVSLSIASGPASLHGSLLTVTGTGPVVVQASQGGDSQWLPAPPVAQTINALPAAAISRIRFNGTGHDAQTANRQAPAAASPIWTDPAGLQSYPWPSFGSPQPAAPGPANVSLPPVPIAPPATP